MISRSNSNVGKKSSSGHRRSATSIDPFVTRQQAESAAVEAYFRLNRQPSPTLEPYKPAPTKVHRRKSQITGRTEGSYLEDARLGRRQSTSKKNENAKPKSSATVQHTRREQVVSPAGEHEKRVVTRRRSVIPPNPRLLQTSIAHATAPPSTRHVRKLHSVYSDGSPAQRNSQPPAQDLSTSRSRTPYTGNGFHETARFDFPAFDSSHGVLHHDPVQRRASVRENQTDEEILAIARDKCSLDFQQGRLRERKSFMQMAFPKRRSTLPNTSGASRNGFDRALPPFNAADDPPLPLDTEHSVVMPAFTASGTVKKGRNFTTTLKGRIMKVMGKTSRGSSGLPAQHVAAQRFHYALDDPAGLVDSDGDRDTAHSRQVAESHVSEPRDGSVRSRVTSWTNSTVAGTMNTRAQPINANDPCINTVDIQRPILRKKSSFFGRSIRNKLRKSSHSELNISEESQRLYTALQSHIQLPEADSKRQEAGEEVTVRATSALSGMPSQLRSTSELRSRSSTIRTVTPNLPVLHPRLPSPVTEVASPCPSATETAQAAHPSHEQLTKRVEKTRNRWKSQLMASHHQHERIKETFDNPYELPFSRRRDDVSPPPTPKQGKVLNTEAVISPSVYSRATDGPSRPDTPLGRAGTTIKITGREVRRYSISPKKATVEPATAQGSAEWRRWLSGEMTVFRPAYEEDASPKLDRPLDSRMGYAEPIVGQKTPQEISRGNDSDELHVRARRVRPRPSSSRKSSFMNDRYPMIDGSRNSSNKSLDNRRVSSAEMETDVTSVVHNVRSIAQLRPGQAAENAVFDSVKMSQRPKSALELRAQYKSRRASTARPLDVRRKTAQDAKITHNSSTIGENTIRDISAGPYAMRTASKDNKENSPLVSPAPHGLPALASSEWLAASTTKVRNTSITPLSIGHHNVSRYSPGKSIPGGKNSPAQRMATQFLEEREKRSQEGAPAFM